MCIVRLRGAVQVPVNALLPPEITTHQKECVHKNLVQYVYLSTLNIHFLFFAFSQGYAAVTWRYALLPTLATLICSNLEKQNTSTRPVPEQLSYSKSLCDYFNLV